jgi:uncharacterized protein (TIGR02118 family)
MIKAISLVKAKEGVSAQAFRDHYENVHVPIIESVLPMIAKYTRCYPDLTNARLAEGQTKAPFDAYTEVCFDSSEDYESYLKALADPAVRAKIRGDEANYVDSAAIYRFLVQECTSYPKKNR